MNRLLATCALCAAVAQSARADDRGVPPPPPHQNPPAADAKATIDRAELQSMIDEAVRRALAANPAYNQPNATGPSPQSAAAYSAPAAATSQQTITVAYATSPVTTTVQQSAQIQVAPGLFKNGLSRLGQKLILLGQPHTRTVSLAPSIMPATQLVTIPAPAALQYQPQAATASPQAAMTYPPLQRGK